MKQAREIARTALPILFILGLIVALVIGIAALTGGFDQLPILLRLGLIGGVVGGLVLLAVQIAGVVKRSGARSRFVQDQAAWSRKRRGGGGVDLEPLSSVRARRRD